MKKVLCVISMMFLALCANAQFMATKEGVKTTDGKDFYVIDIEGKTAKQLYDNIISYIMMNFKNPDAVLNKQEGKMINIHGVFSDAIPCKKVGKFINYADIDLNLIIHFKDGKIRFDAPKINSIERQMHDGKIWKYYFYEGGVTGQMVGVFSLFKKNGKVKNEYAVNGFNEFINTLISDMLKYAKGESEDSEW